MMPILVKYTFLFFIVACIGCSKTSLQTKPISGDDYAVYSAIIQLHLKGNKKVQLVLIRDKTYYHHGLLEDVKKSSPILYDKYKSYGVSSLKNINLKPTQLEKKFNLKREYLLISNYEEIFKLRPNTKQAVKSNPNFIIFFGFSRIAYNTARDKAILLYGISHYYPGGQSAFITLTKVNGVWEVEEDNEFGWVS